MPIFNFRFLCKMNCDNPPPDAKIIIEMDGRDRNEAFFRATMYLDSSVSIEKEPSENKERE